MASPVSDPVGEAPRGPRDQGRIEHSQPTVTPGMLGLYRLWTATKGTLSLDVKRQVMPASAQSTLLTTRRQAERRRGAPSQRGYPAAPQRGQFASQPAYAAPGELPDVAFADTGARVKAMRHVSFGPEFECVKGGVARTAPSLDLGLGFEFGYDTARLRPHARLKFRDFLTIKAFPEPALKLQKRVVLGTSGYGVRLSYEVPLASAATFWEPPARLMVSVDNAVASGLRLTQQGLEFNESLSLLEGDVLLRARGTLTFPCELPVEEGKQLFGWDIKRLGFKTAW